MRDRRNTNLSTSSAGSTLSSASAPSRSSLDEKRYAGPSSEEGLLPLPVTKENTSRQLPRRTLVLRSLVALFALVWLVHWGMSCSMLVNTAISSTALPIQDSLATHDLPSEPTALMVVDGAGAQKWTVSIPSDAPFPLKPGQYLLPRRACVSRHSRSAKDWSVAGWPPDKQPNLRVQHDFLNDKRRRQFRQDTAHALDELRPCKERRPRLLRRRLAMAIRQLHLLLHSLTINRLHTASRKPNRTLPSQRKAPNRVRRHRPMDIRSQLLDRIRHITPRPGRARPPSQPPAPPHLRVRTGYEDLFHLFGDDAKYTSQRTHELQVLSEVSGHPTIAMQIRRGDLHPLEYEYSRDYLPLERYTAAAHRLQEKLAPETKPSGDQPTLLLASDDPALPTNPDLLLAASPHPIVPAQIRIQLATKAALDLSSPANPIRAPGSAYVKHVDENAGWDGGFYPSLFNSLGGVVPATQEGRAGVSDHVMRLRELIGRGYLLDLAVLGSSDGVVCAVGSSACRLVGVMMGWEAVAEGRWINVDDGRGWSWDGKGR
jgi:hypothetical protein